MAPPCLRLETPSLVETFEILGVTSPATSEIPTCVETFEHATSQSTCVTPTPPRTFEIRSRILQMPTRKGGEMST
jgi:hypothetical protein